MPCVDEETATAFAEGRLAPTALTEVEAHVAVCDLCRSLVTAALATRTRGGALAAHGAGPAVAAVAQSAPAAPAAPAASLPRGTAFGRYTILGLTGKGGMGEVYAAYDSELDRRVALKLLHPRASAHDSRYEARLLREARAMAKVSHPNVVAVHDVGTFEGRVFVAMEFVDGVTLKDWLAASPRGRDDILATFIMAARGLAAAHAAGLVHRDFKPQNVMVAADGTARVMDFGLVASVGEAEKEAGPPVLPDVSAEEDVTLTRTGELLGTPLYMAPEQFKGAPTGPRTDQFGFCVALYQALFGESPFEDKHLRALAVAVLSGKRRPPPAGAAVPGWLRQVVSRGLSVDPANRWPTMEDLIAALGRDRTRARRQAALVAGGALLATLSAVALVRHATRPSTLCKSGAAAIASAWPAPSRREAVRTAFARSGAPAVEEVWERVAHGLDRYVDGWLATYGEACAATQLRHEQPAAILDLRMACLGERRTALAALTDVFAAADRDTVQNAVDAVRALPALETCSDLQQLAEPVEAPRDAATRDRVASLRQRLAVAKALTDAGKHEDSERLARAILEEARALGFEPLIVESLVGLTRNYDTFRTPAEVTRIESARQEIVWRGLAVGRLDAAANAAILLFSDFSNVNSSHRAAEIWGPLAEALIARLGQRGELQRSWMLQARSVTALIGGDAPGALALVQQARALKERLLPPDDPDTAISLMTEANALQAVGRGQEALAINERTYNIFVRIYGASSRSAAEALNNLGETLLVLGRPADALKPLRESLARLEALLGPRNPVLGIPMTALGRAQLALGHPREAVPLLERGLRLGEAGQPDDQVAAESRAALVRARQALDR